MKKDEEDTVDKKDRNVKGLLFKDLKILTGDDVLFAGFTSYHKLYGLKDDDETPFINQEEFKVKLEEFKKQKINLGGK